MVPVVTPVASKNAARGRSVRFSQGLLKSWANAAGTTAIAKGDSSETIARLLSRSSVNCHRSWRRGGGVAMLSLSTDFGV
jgi:hypothetical protein